MKKSKFFIFLYFVLGTSWDILVMFLDSKSGSKSLQKRVNRFHGCHKKMKTSKVSSIFDQ